MTTGRCASHGCANSIVVMNLPDNPKLIACLLVNHLRAKVEMRRQSHLRNRAVLIVDRSRGRPRVIDHFPAAFGVDAGMTVEQALSRQVNGIVLEADEAAYCRVFDRMLLSLQGGQRPGGGGGAGHGLRTPGRSGRPVRRRDSTGDDSAERGIPGPGAESRRGRGEVPGLRRRPDQPTPGVGEGSSGCGPLPRASSR